MRIKRICKICGESFYAIKSTQYFCCRKCFKKNYYLKQKILLQEEKQKGPIYPIKECGFCFKKAQLNFDPLKKPNLFDAWACPYCGATNKLIWEHQDKSNSYQIISKILATINFVPVTLQHQYTTYQIPIQRLEQGNSHTIIMICGKTDITDIQCNGRKKISFS
jgi:protein-arginine kinase activator protein McsA